MILCIDVGNTRIKWCIFDGDTVTARGALATRTISSTLNPWAGCPDGVVEARICNVAGPGVAQAINASLLGRYGVCPRIACVSASAGGVQCGYLQPSALGVDRWLAMLAGYQRVSTTVMVVDAGSAMTIDLVASDGVHCGGYILPGLRMLRDALSIGTHDVQVPIAQVSDLLSPALTTEGAVNKGCVLSCIATIERLYFVQPITLIITGGDAKLLHTHLQVPLVLAEDLVLEGLMLSHATFQ